MHGQNDGIIMSTRSTVRVDGRFFATAVLYRHCCSSLNFLVQSIPAILCRFRLTATRVGSVGLGRTMDDRVMMIKR